MRSAKFTLIGFLFIIIFGFINFSCDDGQNNSGNSDEYYVKYEVSGTTMYVGVRLNVTISTENNQSMDFNIGTSPWETIIGPVEKGFNAHLNVTWNTADFDPISAMNTQISVSKNGSPFALKRTGGSTINYTVDY